MLKHFDRERLIWAAELPSNEKIFLLALNSFVDANGECYPGLELLSRMAGFTEKTARNVRDKLKAKGIVATGRRHDKLGQRTSDRYRLDFDALQNLPVNFTSGKDSQWEMVPSLPVNGSEPTGKTGQSLPVTVTRDLPSKNYPEGSTQKDPPFSPPEKEGAQKENSLRSTESETKAEPAAQNPSSPVQSASADQPAPHIGGNVPPPVAPAPRIIGVVESMFEPKPWRSGGHIEKGFCEFVGGQLPNDGRMHPSTKGRTHVINLERGARAGDLDKLNGYWEDYRTQQGDDSEGATPSILTRLMAFTEARYAKG